MDKSRKSQENPRGSSTSAKPTRGPGSRARSERAKPATPTTPAKKANGGDRRRSRAAPRYLLTKVPASSEEPGALTLRRTSTEEPLAARRLRNEKRPETLCELLTRARAKRDAGVPQANIVHWVYDVARELGIRVRHDEFVPRTAPRGPEVSGQKPSSGENFDLASGEQSRPKGTDDEQFPASSTQTNPKMGAAHVATTELPDFIDHGVDDSADAANGRETDVPWLAHEPDSGTPEPSSAMNRDTSQASVPDPGSKTDEIDSADGERTDDSGVHGGGPSGNTLTLLDALLLPSPEAEEDSDAHNAPLGDTATSGRTLHESQGAVAMKHKKGQAVPAPMTVNRGERRLNLFALLNPNAEIPPLDSDKNKTMVGRLILSSARRSAKNAIRLCSESSGVVIDARTWRVLSLPPRAFCSQPTTKDLDRMLGDGLYDIIPADDGTVLTLYAWDHPVEGHIWCLASSNGYDVSTLKWMGPLSYAEVFADLAERLYPEFVKTSGMSLVTGPGGDARLAFKTLDAGKCYTIGLRHHNFHPLREDPERMWQIQHAILGDDSPILCYGVGGLPGIPLQKKFTNLDPSTPRSVADLLQRCHGALERAKMQISSQQRKAGGVPPEGVQKGGAALVANKADVPTLCYGFILRSTDVSRTGSQSDVLIESDLLKSVRRLAYDKAPRQFRDQLTCLTRLEYNAIRAFLTPEDHKTFLALYPAWKPRFHSYDTFIRNVIKQTIHHLRVKSMQLDPSKASVISTKTELIAQEMAAHILRSDPVQAFSPDVEKVVADYVMDPRYTAWYLLATSSSASENHSAAPDQLTH